VTCDLLFRRWPGLEIDRVVREVTTSLTATDNEGYVNIAELCQLIGLINQGRLPSAQPFASSSGWFDSHEEGDYSFEDSESEAHDTLNTLSSIYLASLISSSRKSVKHRLEQTFQVLKVRFRWPVRKVWSGHGFATCAFSKGN
jgi:hypothetical protein